MNTTPPTEDTEGTKDGGRELGRYVIDARRPTRAGGGQCSLIVRRLTSGKIHVLHHGVEYTGAVLSTAQLDELIAALSDMRRAAGVARAES